MKILVKTTVLFGLFSLVLPWVQGRSRRCNEPSLPLPSVFSRVTVAQSSPRTGSISGTILDPTGKPVSGATVTALRQTATPDVNWKSSSTTTDNNGYFSFVALPSGLYDVQVSLPQIWLFNNTKGQTEVVSQKTSTIDFNLDFIDSCGKDFLKNETLTDHDYSEIASWTIEEVIKQPGDLSSNRNHKVVVSLENINQDWIPERLRSQLVLLTPIAIQEKANRHGALTYWELSQVARNGPCIAISICKLWAFPSNETADADQGTLGENCFNYVFRKEAGKWKGKFVTGWVS